MISRLNPDMLVSFKANFLSSRISLELIISFDSFALNSIIFSSLLEPRSKGARIEKKFENDLTYVMEDSPSLCCELFLRSCLERSP